MRGLTPTRSPWGLLTHNIKIKDRNHYGKYLDWNHNILTMVANSQGDLYYNGDGYGYGGDGGWNGWTMGMDLLRCIADGSGGWRLCLATNGSLFGVSPFTKLIGFDLRKAAAHGTGGRYGWGLPVPMPVKVPGTASLSVVNFAMLLTWFPSVIAGPFVIMTWFPAHHSKIEEIAHLCIN